MMRFERVKAVAGAALDLLYPPRCAFCGQLIENAGGVCAPCGTALPFIEDSKALREVDGFSCAVAFYYEEPVRSGVLGLKFGGKSWRAAVFGRYVAQAAAEQLAGQFDAVTYVPVSLRRNLQRGFDQTRLLAKAAAGVWGVRAEPTVRKVRHNRPQSSLAGSEARRENVRGVYAVPHPQRVAGRRFLLIDDVVTTGSTMAACAGALMEAGAASVVCAALAGGHPDEPDEA